MDYDDLSVMITAMAGVFAVLSVIAMVFFIIGCVARYKYLRIRSYENAWMAFIPIANVWAMVEATYGKRERINFYGWDAPATVLKLWPIVIYILALIANVIPVIGNILSMLLYILNIAVMVMIFRDVMEQLDRPQDMVAGVIFVFFRIIAHILMISAEGNFQPGQQDWQTDNRVLNSQTVIGGPLSFLNGKI